MPAEITAAAIGVGAILKWLWTIIILPLVYLFKVHFDLKTDVKVLQVKGTQTKELLKANTTATNKLTDVVQELRIDLAGRDASHRTRKTD